MSEKDSQIQNHESPLRRMMSDSYGVKYTALESLAEARNMNNAYLIMQGDEGGQIYLVIPANLVKCDEKALEVLLKDLDSLSWDDISMANIYYEVYKPNTAVSGGMGGGRAEDGLWVHKDFESIRSKIGRVLEGFSASIK